MTTSVPALRRMPGAMDRPRSDTGQDKFTPPIRTRRLVLVLIVLAAGFFGGIGTWAAFAPLNSAVVAAGSIKVQGDRLVVQHLEGGIVREIPVREGGYVRKGDVVVSLDDTRAQASMAVLHNQLASALASDARLAAEFHGSDAFDVGEELRSLLASYPGLGDVVEHERNLFEANRRMIDGQIAILNERISQLAETIEGFERRREAYSGQLDLVEEELEGLESLLEKGLLPKTRVLARRRDQAGLMGEVAVAEAERQAVMQQITEIKERILQVKRDHLMEVSDARKLVKERIFDLRQRISANEDIARRLNVRAPQSGRIVGLQVNTVGEVIAPGQPLLEIVPENSTFVVEAQVNPDDIDQVARDGSARVRLTAFNFRTTPPLPAQVVEVSADTFEHAETGLPYYKVEVVLDADGVAALGDRVQTLPGMQAQVMISTGTQTIADYVLGPIIGNLEVALIESD